MSWEDFGGPALRLIEKLLTRQASIIALGAEGTGKTSFMERLSQYELPSTFSRPSTIGLDQKYIRPIPKDISIPILYSDVGGGLPWKFIRRQTFKKVKPLGILFFLDHRSNEKTQKGVYGEQNDDGSWDMSRIKRHHEACDELYELLQSEAKAKSSCNAIIIAVNKCDLWKKSGHTVNDFHKEFENDIAKISSLGELFRMSAFLPCSTFTGEGMDNIIRTTVSMTGVEVLLPFGIRLKFSPKPL